MVTSKATDLEQQSKQGWGASANENCIRSAWASCHMQSCAQWTQELVLQLLEGTRSTHSGLKTSGLCCPAFVSALLSRVLTPVWGSFLPLDGAALFSFATLSTVSVWGDIQAWWLTSGQSRITASLRPHGLQRDPVSKSKTNYKNNSPPSPKGGQRTNPSSLYSDHKAVGLGACRVASRAGGNSLVSLRALLTG